MLERTQLGCHRCQFCHQVKVSISNECVKIPTDNSKFSAEVPEFLHLFNNQVATLSTANNAATNSINAGTTLVNTINSRLPALQAQNAANKKEIDDSAARFLSFARNFDTLWKLLATPSTGAESPYNAAINVVAIRFPRY